MEFAALWAALWLGRTTTPPQGIAEIISTLNLRCPGHHKRLFHEDVPAQGKHSSGARSVLAGGMA
jgi:hypothetical protein